MHASVLAAERGDGLTGKTVRSAVAMVVAVVSGVTIAAQRRGCDGARGPDCAADHAGGYVSRPESTVAVFDYARTPCDGARPARVTCPAVRMQGLRSRWPGRRRR